ncbi:GNAT family N-acetyltransferase [Amycolatopsis sp. FDAARGOS 1241]|uniref:GNAT family N-acetyltransferase n=1 Tax=Amycolatopsis sp. FDAARGOS 1241 TaxID=2778070 RepID=UPI00194F8D6B|nr:GNAT family N-acetyltransferase [Amycolatopsis sp. FDAARGOS 1241]QRP50107.1 GNAT family N-acetyltransferase [Amycolatopsis sp. FDAARGOS 1241]
MSEARATEPAVEELGAGDPRSESELFPLLRQLRPHLTREQFGELVTTGHEQGLRYFVAYAGGAAPAAAGYRLLVTSCGRLLYVDDLMTAEEARSTGVGRRPMSEVEQPARRHGCTRLEPDSGVSNTAAHRFYIRNEFDLIAYHFAVAVAR